MTDIEDVIRQAPFRYPAHDLDTMLTVLDAYRDCARTARRLHGQRGMGQARDHALECAAEFRKTLERWAYSGKMAALGAPAPAR